MTTAQATKKMKRLVKKIDELDQKIEEASRPLESQRLRSKKGFYQETIAKLERKYPTAGQKV